MKTPDAHPASDADSFDCTDTIGHTNSIDSIDTELGRSPGHSDAFDSRASNSRASDSQAEAAGSH